LIWSSFTDVAAKPVEEYRTVSGAVWLGGYTRSAVAATGWHVAAG
jgi:hypothetical protein